MGDTFYSSNMQYHYSCILASDAHTLCPWHNSHVMPTLMSRWNMLPPTWTTPTCSEQDTSLKTYYTYIPFARHRWKITGQMRHHAASNQSYRWSSCWFKQQLFQSISTIHSFIACSKSCIKSVRHAIGVPEALGISPTVFISPEKPHNATHSKRPASLKKHYIQASTKAKAIQL